MKNVKPFIIIGINKNKKIKFRLTVLNFILAFAILIAFSLSLVLANKILVLKQEQDLRSLQAAQTKHLEDLQAKVIKDKYVFNIKWGELGRRMVEDGVIDKTKLARALTGKDELPENLEKYFSPDQKQIELTMDNSRFWVDILWALGLANKNLILEEGEMVTSGDPSNFASTGGYTLGASENAMNYYSKFSYIILSSEQQEKVLEIAKNIYRPCCGNSTAFPDCNHGMAMLGLIELMVSQGKGEEEIYKTALAFNSYWFPQTYLETAYYLNQNSQDYSKTSPKELLSKKFSSAMRDEAVTKSLKNISWPTPGGGSCGA